jgi:AcrR family transcriptional regulator
MAYQVMFLRAVPGFEPSDHALGVCTGTFESLVAAVQRAMHGGVIADGPPTETAQLIWATIHGWVSLELLGLGFVEDQDAAYDRLCEALLRGLRPESP